MIVTAWNNGAHHESGAGYGLKIDSADRDRYFSKDWQNVVIQFPDGRDAAVNIEKDSFWNATCRELIHQEIGQWLRSQALAPWPDGKPPKLSLEPTKGNHFTLKRTAALTLEQDLERKRFVQRAKDFRTDVLGAVSGTSISTEETGGNWPERATCLNVKAGNAFAQFVCKAPEDLKGNAASLQDLWAISVKTNMDATEHLFFCAKDGWRVVKALADYRGKIEGIEHLYEFVKPLLVQTGLPLGAVEASHIARA